MDTQVRNRPRPRRSPKDGRGTIFASSARGFNPNVFRRLNKPYLGLIKLDGEAGEAVHTLGLLVRLGTAPQKSIWTPLERMGVTSDRHAWLRKGCGEAGSDTVPRGRHVPTERNSTRKSVVYLGKLVWFRNTLELVVSWAHCEMASPGAMHSVLDIPLCIIDVAYDSQEGRVGALGVSTTDMTWVVSGAPPHARESQTVE